MKKFTAMLLTSAMAISMVPVVANAEEEVVTLKWVAVGGGMPSNYDAWLEKINPYLEEKIGVNIDMEVVGWGDWDNRRNVIINTGESYDIIFGNDGNFVSDVQLGAYEEITQEMLEEYAPDLLALVPESYWDACKVDGKIYAVPTYKDSSMTNYFVWDKELLDANGIDPSDAHDLASVTPYMYELKDKTDETIFPQSSSGATWIVTDYDSFSSGLPAVGVKIDDETRTVVPVFEQEDFMESLKILHQLYQDGIINADAATNPETHNYSVCGVAQGWSGAAKTVWGPGMGVEALAVQYKNTIVSNSTVQGSLNSISINSEHPEKALAFLNLINSDSYVRDSFYYGLEGDNWDYTDDGRVHKYNSDWSMAGYTQGTFFIVTQTDDVDFNQWDEVKELNAAATPSVLLGFAFDTTPVADELANCGEIYSRYRPEIFTGTTDPEEAIPQMMSELRAAGLDTIIEEAQNQINTWAEGLEAE